MKAGTSGMSALLRTPVVSVPYRGRGTYSRTELLLIGRRVELLKSSWTVKFITGRNPIRLLGLRRALMIKMWICARVPSQTEKLGRHFVARFRSPYDRVAARMARGPLNRHTSQATDSNHASGFLAETPWCRQCPPSGRHRRMDKNKRRRISFTHYLPPVASRPFVSPAKPCG